MKKIEIKGKQEFLGVNIPIIAGGFGKNQKVILAKTIAEIHNTRLDKVNSLINNNKEEFEYGIDILDLKDSEEFANLCRVNEIYSQNALNAAKTIYLLSEQGYMLLVGFMKTEKAKEIRKQLRREYFVMREIINSDEQKKAQILLKLYNGGADAIIAGKELAELEVKEAKVEVVKQLQPKIDLAERFTNSKNTYDVGKFAKVLKIKDLGRNNLFAWMRSEEILRYSNEPYQKYMKYFEVTCSEYNGKTTYKTWITSKGILFLYKKLIKNGKIISKSVDEIISELDEVKKAS